MKMITKSSHEYGTPPQKLEPGDPFECEPEHVNLLTMLGRAVPAEHHEEMPDGPTNAMAFVGRGMPKGKLKRFAH